MTALKIMIFAPIPWLIFADRAALKLMMTAIEQTNSPTPPTIIAVNQAQSKRYYSSTSPATFCFFSQGYLNCSPIVHFLQLRAIRLSTRYETDTLNFVGKGVPLSMPLIIDERAMRTEPTPAKYMYTLLLLLLLLEPLSLVCASPTDTCRLSVSRSPPVDSSRLKTPSSSYRLF